MRETKAKKELNETEKSKLIVREKYLISKSIRESGITLIALIVTIIVLLILAGVSIATLTGDNGILTQANRAKEETELSEQEEMENLDSTVNIIGQYVKEKLSKNITGNNYGEYVEYNIDLNENGILTDDWRIFYNNGKNVFLIAADYLDNDKLPEEVKMTADKEFSKYSIYWSDNNLNEVENGSVKEDIANKFMFNYIFEQPNSTDNLNMKAVSILLDTNVWDDFANGIEGAEAIGGPTLELFIASWNEKRI